MPITSQVTPLPIYATIDRSKKTKARLSSVSHVLPSAISNQQSNIKTHLFEKTLSPSKLSNVGRGNGIETAGKVKNISGNGSDYVNFQFAQSLEYYENSKDFLKKPNISLNEVLAKKNQFQQQSVPTNEIKVCMKCGHSCDQGSFGYNDKHGDYLIMEPPCKNINTEEKKYHHHKIVMNYPGYLPMQPVSAVGSGIINSETIECISFMTNKLLLGRATSSPSLSASFLEKSSKQTDTSLRTPYTVLELDFPESCTPPLHRKQFNRPGVGIELKSKESSMLRKRSNSADSARYIDDLESIEETGVFTSPSLSNTQGCSGTNCVVSLPNHSLTIQGLTDPDSNSTSSNFNINSCGNNFVVDNNIKEVPYNDLSQMEINVGPRFSARDTVRLKGQASHIRRSSSVPCKSGYNRDSSSSNDSGVSIGSLKQRGSDFVEFELPLTTSMSTRHNHTLKQHRRITQPDCLNTYLPKRSKSSDLLRDVTFEFEDMKIITHKSSSAEAEVPICLIKKISKGYVGPNNVPFIDSRSTSSGTSDMSDYIETLSLSSFSSSDTPDSLRLSRSAATTLRPRSGKEYHKIDRCMLDEDMRYVSKNEHPETKS